MTDPKLWVAVSFILFIALVARIGWRFATKALDGRAERVRSELREAAQLRAEAEAMLRAAEAERAAALAEAEDLIARAQAEAERVAARTAAELEAQARAREKMALDRIAAAEAAALAEVRAAAAEIAAGAAAASLRQMLDPAEEGLRLDRAVADLPRAFRSAA